LATKWEVVDGTNWRFHLRDDLTFWDGTPVTAHDFKFSLDEQLNRPGSARGILTPLKITEVEVVDDYTVDVKMAQLNVQAGPRMIWVWVLPKDYIERVGWDGFLAEPMGSGPYKWSEWEAWDHTFAEKVDREHPFRTVTLDKIEFYDVNITESAVAALRTGALDLISAYFEPEVVKDLDDKGFEVYVGGANKTSVRVHAMDACRLGRPACDKRVRQAFNLAIDRDSISDNIWMGYAQPISQPAFPMRAGYNHDIEPTYDPAKAEELLDAAGFPRGDDGYRFEVKFMNWMAGTPHFMALAMVDMWDKVGIKVAYEKVDISVQLDYLFRKGGREPYDLAQYENAGTYPENDPFTGQCNDASAKLCYFPYDNDKFYELQAAYQGEPDPVKRAELVRQGLTILVEDPLDVWATTVPQFAVHHPKVKGFAYDSYQKLFWDDVWIDESAS